MSWVLTCDTLYFEDIKSAVFEFTEYRGNKWHIFFFNNFQVATGSAWTGLRPTENIKA